MRAMIWNVWWRFGGAWRDREPGILATLAQVRPDLVGLVETWAGDGTTQPDRPGRATPAARSWCRGRSSPATGRSTAGTRRTTPS